MNTTDFFSASVPEAERKFLEACKQAGATSEFIPYPAKGLDDEDLHVGICHAGSESAKNILFIVSATHGVEGFAGAALQTGLLRNFKSLNLDADTALVMVHMINPWGAAWSRRETEENIDLFRNFHYCDKPIEPDPLYDEIDDAMDLAHWPKRSEKQRAKVEQEIFAKYGSDRVVAAIRRGQHHRPKGMTYHGKGPCWNKRTLDSIVSKYLNRARLITVMDVHTGFGDYGTGMVIVYDKPGSEKHRRISSWMDGDIYTPGEHADTPPHTFSPYDFIEQLIPGVEVTCAVLEYGTFEPAETREIFPANAHYHLYGDPLSSEGRAVANRYRRFCYPEEDNWKEQVWEDGKRITQLLLAGMKQWASEKSSTNVM